MFDPVYAIKIKIPMWRIILKLRAGQILGPGL
jgi:hypothetical protein